MIILSGCKINLGLRITGIAENGYHSLYSIFYPLVLPQDRLEIQTKKISGLEFGELPPYLDKNQNTLAAAYKLFTARTDKKPGILLNIKKRIPAGAGLGGGSGNAAAFLIWLNHYCGSLLDEKELLHIASEIGADVPFFIKNIPCEATGYGQILQPINFKGSGLWALIIFPGISINTRQIFLAWDALNARRNFLTRYGNENNDFDSLHDPLTNIDLTNDLEEPVYSMWPQLRSLKLALLSQGASKAAMSGTGSAHYGIFGNARKAHEAAIFFRKKHMRAYLAPMQDFGA